MFTLTQMPVTFVGLTVLFAWCLIWTVRDSIVATNPPQRVSSIIHAVMALTMLAMVPTSWWRPLSSAVGYPLLITAFCLFTAWMAAMALWRPSWLAWGHAVMFGAMVWHLSAMGVMHRAMSRMAEHHSGMGHGNMHHSGMGHGGMEDPMAAMAPTLHTFAVIGVPFMLGLLALAVSGLVRTITGRQGRDHHSPACHVPPTNPLTVRLSGLSDFAMGFGMAWMSTGLMVPLLPFMAHLHP